jgi:hypothetical protein
MNFLPEGFDKIKTTRPYWKMSEMKDGDNKFRIVCRPIAGWVDWEGTKPIRYLPENKPTPVNADKPAKPFWSCYVWDYAREGLYILEITQSTILKALVNYAQDEDWGDFTKYDFKLRKEGSGKDSKYFLSPLPHKEMNEKIRKALEAAPVRLEALYEGRDPWDVNSMDLSKVQDGSSLLAGGIDELKEYLEVDGIDTSYLDSYLEMLSKSKGQTVDQIIESALIPQLLPKFKSAYLKDLSRREASSAA